MALRSDPEKTRAWKQRSQQRYYEKQRKVAAMAGKPKNKPPKPKMRRMSIARERQMKEYYAVRTEWLKRPENSACEICPCRGQYPAPATETHHFRGRRGRLLCDTRFFVASCRGCREIVHDRPKWARENGLLSSATEWDVYPGPPAPEN